jgi:hypothetical protein
MTFAATAICRGVEASDSVQGGIESTVKVSCSFQPALREKVS